MRRAGLDRRATIACCGPGAAALTEWATRQAEEHRFVLLAGLAGDVSGRHAPGSAVVATEVRGPDGTTWRPTEVAASPCVVTQAAAVVRDEAARVAMAARGVDVVDMESVAFAQGASGRGWRWGIVRGISDDARSPLPVGVETWVDECGGARPLRVAGAVLRRPASLASLLRLRRNSTAALRAVAALIDERL